MTMTAQKKKPEQEMLDMDEMSYSIVHVPSEAKPEEVKAGNSLADMYDRYKKLIYVFDISWSMNDGMAMEDFVRSYKWPKEKLDEFRAAVKAVMEEMDDEDAVDGDILEQEENVFDFDLNDDEALKRAILEHNWQRDFGIALEKNESFKPVTITKMTAVKNAAKEFVNARFNKFPDAQVLVYAFDNRVEQRTRGFGRDIVLSALDSLNPAGGTDITPAVKAAVAECRARPSQLGANHIVLVSDGMDYNAVDVEKLLPEMKQRNIVFDFIFVTGSDTLSPSDMHVINVLEKICKETGGEFTTVRTVKDFQVKFLQASTRLCLPPGPK